MAIGGRRVSPKDLKICFLSAREPKFHRNSSILRTLQTLGHDVTVCSSTARTYVVRIPISLLSFLRCSEFDLLFIGFLGHPYALFGRRCTRTKIIFDAFLSPYDTLCLDRQHFSPDSVLGGTLKKLETTAYNRVDRILFDTRTHVEYVAREFSLNRDKLRHLYVGADEGIFYPVQQTHSDDVCNVIWYGSFLPLQGVGIIRETIELLSKEEQLSFTIVGRGLESKEFVRWLKRRKDLNVTHIPWLSLEKLGELVRRADIFLGGHFSNIPKASRVISTKAFEGAAAGKAMILGDNPANREIFRPNRDAIFVEMAKGEALANAIINLASDPSLREKLGIRARDAYIRSASTETLARDLDTIITEVIYE